MPKLLRETKQRNAIKRAFFEYRRPLSPKEVLGIASEDVPNLGIATVYRNIKAMVEENELATVEIPGQAPRYCLPRERTPFLFVCQETDRVFFLEPDTTRVDISSIPGEARVDRYEVVFYGKYIEASEAEE